MQRKNKKSGCSSNTSRPHSSSLHSNHAAKMIQTFWGGIACFKKKEGERGRGETQLFSLLAGKKKGGEGRWGRRFVPKVHESDAGRLEETVTCAISRRQNCSCHHLCKFGFCEEKMNENWISHEKGELFPLVPLFALASMNWREASWKRVETSSRDNQAKLDPRSETKFDAGYDPSCENSSMICWKNGTCWILPCDNQKVQSYWKDESAQCYNFMTKYTNLTRKTVMKGKKRIEKKKT